MIVRTPKYRLHKGSGQALVCFEGRRYYLGRHGTPESKQEYRRLVAEWLARGTVDVPSRRKPMASPDAVTLAEVCAAYKRFAESYYRKNGELSGSIPGIYAMLDLVAGLYGDLAVAEFDSAKFDAIVCHMVAKGWSRTYVNDHIGRIKRLFKWAARQKLVPVSVWHEVQLVGGVQVGRTEAYEPDPVEPVDEAVVDATVPYLPSVVADMVRLHRATGMRPGEVCVLRPCDIDRTEPIWTYKPHRHKLQHKGLDRIVFIGPTGQAILLPYLLRDPATYCFSPREAVVQVQAGRRERRQSKVQPSQISRRNPQPKREPGGRYTTGSYRVAIQRAALRADKEAHREQPEVDAEQRLVPCWSPNQLRHLAATVIRAEFGLEAAAAILGHTRVSTTEIYAQSNKQRAVEVVGRIG